MNRKAGKMRTFAPSHLRTFAPSHLRTFAPSHLRTLLSDSSAPKRRGVLVLALLAAAFLTVACAPPESNGITNSPPKLPWMRVAAGVNHTLAINSRGELYAWGANNNGQLGIGTTTDNELTPQRVGSDSDWKVISGGDDYSLALKSDGTLYAWGKNDRGQLGINSNENKTTPQQVGNDSDWKTIAAGNKHSLALKSDNTLYAWGGNFYGELGNGENNADLTDTSKDKTEPIQIGTDSDWEAVSAGGYYSLALKDTGELYTWGHNKVRQLGLGDNTNRNRPEKVGSDNDWKTVSAGFAHSLALKNDNTLYAWGWNWEGQVGNGKGGSFSDQETTPQKISTATNWNGIAAGYRHSLAFKDNGEIYAWGNNSDEQLGDGTNVDRSGLTKVKSDDTDWKAVGGGEIYSLALKENGTLYTWGDKSRLGIITNEDKGFPTPVPHP